MNILHVIPCYLDRYGGPVVAAKQLTRTLVSFGIDVSVFTTDTECRQPYVRTDEGVQVYYFPAQFPKSFFFSPSLRDAIKDRLEEFDLVHIYWLYVYTTLVASRQCIRKNIPYILSPHGMLDHCAVTTKGRIKKHCYLSFIEKPHIYHAHLLHYCSEGEKKHTYSLAAKIPSVVIPNGIELALCPPEKSLFQEKYPETKGKKIVLFLGRINYIKGLDLLAEAWSIVSPKFSEAHLVLAGPDEDGYGKVVKSILRQAQVLNKVTFTGLLGKEEKYAALFAAEIIVCSSYLESFGVAIVEGMSCAKPVVVTEGVRISQEIHWQRAGIVTGFHPKEIADGLSYLLTNQDFAREMGQRGKKMVEEFFELKSVTRKMLQVYKRVIKESRHSL